MELDSKLYDLSAAIYEARNARAAADLEVQRLKGQLHLAELQGPSLDRELVEKLRHVADSW